MPIEGRVTDQNEAPVGDAVVTITPAGAAGGESLRAVTDPAGKFSLMLTSPGDYVVEVQREGYFALRNDRVRLEPGRELTLVLNPLRELFQSINVNESPSRVGLDQTSRQERLSGTEINDVPYPSSHSLRNGMKLIPGVIQDSAGTLHFEGANENQVQYLLNDFSVSDPITGRFNTNVAVDGIRNLEFQTGRYPAEFGKGSAGVMAIHTNTGSDQFRYTATNFLPSIDTSHGVQLGNWTPRFGFSGPIRRGRAWFADNFGAQYDEAYVNGLPKGQDFRSGWSGTNLLHNQVNLTPAQILFADFLTTFETQSRAGLGPLDPASTTSTLRSHEYFVSAKDQMYLGRGTLVEFGYAHTSFVDRHIPQGDALYVLSPEGRSGNYFVKSTQTASRDQILANAFVPAFQFLGSHQVKVGIDLDRLTYQGDFHRTGFELIGLVGDLLSRTLFTGNGQFERQKFETSSYALDTWRPHRNVQLELGIRQDWDDLVHQVAFSPRVSLSYSPGSSGLTTLSAGYAITRDTANLALFSRPLDQSAVTTRYNPDGSVAAGPLAATYVIDGRHLRLPRYANWSGGVSRRFPHRIDASVNYLRRRGRDGFAYLDLSSTSPLVLPLLAGAGASGVYTLTNARRDHYDAVQLSVHQSLAGQYEWMASYTRSRATSNAVLDLNIDEPFQVTGTLVPLPWDAPNRLLAWAYLPLPRKNWALAVLADARSGFSFSVADENGHIMGPVDSHRFPINFDLNVHIERRFTFHGYRLALRAGFNNITDHANPASVNNTIGAPGYLHFLGTEGRHVVVRLRVFGRTTGK